MSGAGTGAGSDQAQAAYLDAQQQRRQSTGLSSISVSGDSPNDDGGRIQELDGLDPPSRPGSAQVSAISSPKAMSSPEPDFYGTLNDGDDAFVGAEYEMDVAGLEADTNGEAGYVRRPRQRKQCVKRAGSLDAIDFMQQLSGHPNLQVSLSSGAVSVDGAEAVASLNVGQAFDAPLSPLDSLPPPPASIDLKRRHSTGDLDIDLDDSPDLDDYDILGLPPAYVGSSGTSGMMSAAMFGSASGTPASASSRRISQRRPSGDLISKKSSSKTVTKRRSTLKKSGSNNSLDSLASLDRMVTGLDVGGVSVTGSIGDSPAGTGKKKTLTKGDGKSRRSWKKPKDKPKRPLSAYNLFFQHERACIVNGGDGEAGNTAAGAAPGATPDAETTTSATSASQDGTSASSGQKKKRRHRTAHGKIGFAALAQTIAARWKALPADERKPFADRAAIEKERYRAEMEVWNKKQKEKRLVEQREEMQKYREDRNRLEEVMAQEQQQHTTPMQQQQNFMKTQDEGQGLNQPQPMPHDQMVGGMDQVQSNAQLQHQQQQMMMTMLQEQVRGSNPNPEYGQQAQVQMQPQAFGSMGGNMANGSKISTMNNMGSGQQHPSSQDHLQMQQAAKLQQILQAQQILQMQAMDIKRQQMQEQQQQRQHQIQQQQIQIQQLQMIAQMGSNSSINPLGGWDTMSTDQQQMQQLVVGQVQQQQQQALGQSGAQGIVPLDAFGSSDEDFESDEAIKDMLNNFDVANLDSLGFEFDSKGQSR